MATTGYQTLHMRDDSGATHEVELDRPERDEIEAECQEWVEGGDWGSDGASVSVYWRLLYADGDEVDSGSTIVDIDPDHDALIAAAGGDTDCEHEWTGEGEGGCDQNPGVWSTGGTGLVLVRHCRHCGLRRTEHHLGAQRNPGEHDTFTYELPSDEEVRV